jgi:ZIP family zinc transporter
MDPAWLADRSPIMLGLGASLAAGLATGVGALPVLVLGRIPPRLESAMLGFAAGVMLAATMFSLIVPGLEAAREGDGGQGRALLVVGTGIMLGALALWLIDEHAPHEHFIFGREGRPTTSLRRIWLFIIAITLHNFPEGLAVGVGFGAGDLGNATALALGIGLQNLPEGLAVAVALIGERYGRAEAFGIALLTGLVEPVGGLVGVTAVVLAEPLLPWGLAFAAGAMLFVISDEIIPETHRKGVQKVGTFGLMIGFVVMMSLDVALG